MYSEKLIQSIFTTITLLSEIIGLDQKFWLKIWDDIKMVQGLKFFKTPHEPWSMTRAVKVEANYMNLSTELFVDHTLIYCKSWTPYWNKECRNFMEILINFSPQFLNFWSLKTWFRGFLYMRFTNLIVIRVLFIESFECSNCDLRKKK